MKDMPALLCAVLSVKDRALLTRVFPRVIDNAKMLRNFVQIMRSGVVGRKSLGTRQSDWCASGSMLAIRTTLFKANVGQDPSLADIVKMVHPKPKDAGTRSTVRLLHRSRTRGGGAAGSGSQVRGVQARPKRARVETVPDVPFQMLTALELGTTEWTAIARRAPWQMTRMNLNTFARHGVFGQPGLPELIAERLRDPAKIARARVFPYQLMVAYTMAVANTQRPARSFARRCRMRWRSRRRTCQSFRARFTSARTSRARCIRR